MPMSVVAILVWCLLTGTDLPHQQFLRRQSVAQSTQPQDRNTGQEPPEPVRATAMNPHLPEGLADEGWPFVRGPAFDGHSPEIHIAESWPLDGPPVFWTRPLGQGYSAFVCSDQRVVTQAQTLAGQFVICLDADTGETLWEYQYDGRTTRLVFIPVHAPHPRLMASMSTSPRQTDWLAA